LVGQNKKEVQKEEIQSKMANLFKSFFMKSGGDDNEGNDCDEEG
jgi:hypothetical protein